MGAAALPRPEVDRREVALVRDAQRGSVRALEQLFRLHWPRAYRAALLVVDDAAAAEDIAQESFLAAVRALDRFDRRRPFGPWLHRIVVNRAIDWSRARTLRRELGGDAAPPSLRRRCARPAAARTSSLRRSPSSGAEHRAVIVLRYLLDYTPGEIAELLDLPRGTVNSRLRRGLDRLEEVLRMNVKRLLERVPADREAEERAWSVVRAAYAEREHVRVRPRRRLMLAGVALAARRRSVGVLASGPRGRQCGSPHDRDLARCACALPAARAGPPARERRRRHMGRRAGRLEAAARRLRRGGVVAARALS